MNILNKVNSSDDIKKLDSSELEPLCQEIRDHIIDCVSKTGGHLASNLGAVELTVALHRVYDTKSDRIVFDVGHQSYAHKVITGRRDALPTIRQYNGLSGFPKPHEAVDDAFIAGHASNSVSVALGMARARSLQNESYNVAAVIGDGALTGGLAYEGLENAGSSNEPMVIIINDNGMSISGNVGGIAKLLSRERLKPGYINFKRWYRSVVGNNTPLYNANHRFKEAVKRKLLPANMFDAMGLYYLGPVDGHDIEQLETVLRWAKDMKSTVLVHVISKKGKGCPYAEEHPEKYHGVGSFDPATGVMPEEGESFSSCFGNALVRLAEKNDKVVAITAAMCDGTGLSAFAERFPERFFDVGIAEQHAVSMAAGMAKQGLAPVFAVYSSFLQRSYDMLIHDVALSGLHVVFCVDRAGIVGRDGETHHGVFDISYLSSVPGMTVLCPSSFAELESMLEKAVNEMDGPVAIRYPRGGEGEFKDMSSGVICPGSDITLSSYGIMINELIEARRIMAAEGVSAEIVRLAYVSPLDDGAVLDSVRKTGHLLVAEDVCSAGCVGESILCRAELAGIAAKTELCNLGSGIVPHGSVQELMRDCELDAQSIANKALALLRGVK